MAGIYLHIPFCKTRCIYCDFYFKHIFETIRENYGMEHCREITLEANPDDLSQEYLKMLSSLPFNRISMGIQTFDDTTLRLLKRRHSSQTAVEEYQH